jgi:large repetitive protein
MGEPRDVVSKPIIATTSLPNGSKNTTYSQALSVSSDLAPYSWSINGVPSWLLLAASGVLAGKPTTSGTCSFIVKVTDSLGNAATRSFSIKVN